MNTNRRTKSISRKINGIMILKLFSSFLAINIVIVVLTATMWTYSSRTYDDSNSLFSVDTELIPASSLLEENNQRFEDSRAFRDYKNSSNKEIKIVFPQSFREYLKEQIFVYRDNSDREFYVYAGGPLVMLASALYMLSALELLILIGTTASGSRKIRSSLSPLDELAFTAQFIGKSESFDQQDLDNLEAAINAISPSSDGARLNTGNSEMEDLENSINHLIDRMRENYKQQSRFVSDASHELRTPISVLQGYADMLDRWGKDDEKVLNESIDAIKSETAHMKKLVEQLLFLARGDSGKTQLTIEDFDLNSMLKEVYEESLMIDKKHVYEFLPGQDDVMARGDVAMLKQTARILIDNASKYTPEGSEITLKAYITDKGNPAFVIQDEGIGIVSKDASHMFDRFYRADPARAKDSGGTGLGLSIAKWIVDRHGGHFDVLSRKDIGTRITVFLP